MTPGTAQSGLAQGKCPPNIEEPPPPGAPALCLPPEGIHMCAHLHVYVCSYVHIQWVQVCSHSTC